MKQQTIILLLIISEIFTSCGISTMKKQETYKPNDTTTSFKIKGYWATPKKTFDFNSLGKSTEETLHIVTCSEYVYFPFGKLTDKSSIENSLLNNFTITEFKRDTFTNIMMPSDPDDDFHQWTEYVELKLGENKLSLFLDNDPEASMHGYMRSGQIVDNKVLFSENIRIGMSSTDFFNCFFEYFPIELIQEYKTVEFESCVADVTHIYTFDNGKLSSVSFASY